MLSSAKQEKELGNKPHRLTRPMKADHDLQYLQ